MDESQLLGDKVYRKQVERLIETLRTGKDVKTGLTFRPMELTEKTRTRGGKKSRRRTARVWKPRDIKLPELPEDDGNQSDA